MSDLTIIFVTVNLVPKKWAKFQKETLLEAAGESPIITISKTPLNWGHKNLIQKGKISESSIYRQMLRGAKLAKTPYIAVAEDDTLYPKEHFHSFRPPLDTFAYNFTRWGILTWGTPTYYWRNRFGNMSMIAPTKLAVDYLKEAFAKNPNYYGELGVPKVTKQFGLPSKKVVTFFTEQPILYFQHKYGIDPLEKSQRKKMSTIKAFEIPLWGKSKTIVKKFE